MPTLRITRPFAEAIRALHHDQYYLWRRFGQTVYRSRSNNRIDEAVIDELKKAKLIQFEDQTDYYLKRVGFKKLITFTETGSLFRLPPEEMWLPQ